MRGFLPEGEKGQEGCKCLVPAVQLIQPSRKLCFPCPDSISLPSCFLSLMSAPVYLYLLPMMQGKALMHSQDLTSSQQAGEEAAFGGGAGTAFAGEVTDIVGGTPTVASCALLAPLRSLLYAWLPSI